MTRHTERPIYSCMSVGIIGSSNKIAHYNQVEKFGRYKQRVKKEFMSKV